MKKFVFFICLALALCDEMDFESDFNIGGFTQISNAIIDTYKNIANAFKTTISETIRAKIKTEGFRELNAQSESFVKTGIMAQYYDKICDRLGERIGIENPEKRKKFRESLDDAQYQESDVWNEFDIKFVNEKTNKANFAAFFINNRIKDEKYDLIACNIKSTFKLAPNLMIIDKSASYAGGIFMEQKTLINEIPKDLDIEEIKGLGMFFKLIAFEILANFFGIQLPFSTKNI